MYNLDYINILKNSYQVRTVRYRIVRNDNEKRFIEIAAMKVELCPTSEISQNYYPLQNGGSIILTTAICFLRIIFGIYRNSFDLLFDTSGRNRIADS